MTEIEQDLAIEEFCQIHNACKEGRNWAIANCKTMAECWEKLPSGYLIWAATCKGVLSDKELRLFAVFCCREIWILLTDERSRNAVEVAEKFAIGQATRRELQAAALAARDAALAAALAASDAALAAAYDAALAARDAAYAAALAARDAALAAALAAADAALAAAYDAALAARDAAYAAADAALAEAYAAGDAARDAALAAARQKQADWLRANTTPNFKRITTNDRA